MTHRVAIVGAGNWSANHIAAWRRRPDVEIGWIVRSSAERARASADALGIAGSAGDYREVLGRDDVDIVDILLPHDLHVAAAVAALEAGKHVLLEKPIAVDMAGAERIAAAAKASGRVLMIAENWLFASVVRKARELIAAGAIGRVFVARSATDLDVRHMFRGNAWKNDAGQSGGGVLMDGGTHNVSVLRHLVGEIAGAVAMTGCYTYPEAAPTDDTGCVMVRFENGAIGMMSTTIGAAVERPSTAFTFLGTEGTIDIDTHRDAVILRRKDERTETVIPGASRGFDEQAAHFLACIGSGATPLTSAEDQMKSLAAVIAAYRSVETGAITRPGA